MEKVSKEIMFEVGAFNTDEYWKIIFDDVDAQNAFDNNEITDEYIEDWEINPDQYMYLIYEDSYYTLTHNHYGRMYLGVYKSLSEAQTWLNEYREEIKEDGTYKCYRSPMSLKLVMKEYDKDEYREYETTYIIKPVRIL